MWCDFSNSSRLQLVSKHQWKRLSCGNRKKSVQRRCIFWKAWKNGGCHLKYHRGKYRVYSRLGKKVLIINSVKACILHPWTRHGMLKYIASFQFGGIELEHMLTSSFLVSKSGYDTLLSWRIWRTKVHSALKGNFCAKSKIMLKTSALFAFMPLGVVHDR